MGWRRRRFGGRAASQAGGQPTWLVTESRYARRSVAVERDAQVWVALPPDRLGGCTDALVRTADPRGYRAGVAAVQGHAQVRVALPRGRLADNMDRRGAGS